MPDYYTDGAQDPGRGRHYPLVSLSGCPPPRRCAIVSKAGIADLVGHVGHPGHGFIRQRFHPSGEDILHGQAIARRTECGNGLPTVFTLMPPRLLRVQGRQVTNDDEAPWTAESQRCPGCPT